jgi:FixJ family two-component response regulator
LSTLSVISVIDDDASVRTATNNLLSSHGYLIQTFVSADDFLQSDRLDDSACVIADVQMTAMSGLDLLTHMRVKGYTVPLIFITAFPDENVRARALKAGAIGFLAKPFAGPVLKLHRNSSKSASRRPQLRIRRVVRNKSLSCFRPQQLRNGAVASGGIRNMPCNPEITIGNTAVVQSRSTRCLSPFQGADPSCHNEKCSKISWPLFRRVE